MELAEINISSEASPDISVSGVPLAPLNVKVCCNTSGDKTRENVTSNSKRNLAWVKPLDEHKRIAVIVGGGPSLKSNWTDMFYWLSQGADIFALNGACKFLNDRGILPTYQVIVDPRPNQQDMIGFAKDYLFASQCDQGMFEAVPEDRTGLFHMAGSAMGLVNGTLVGGDVTVGLVTPNLAYTLGYRNMHLYGYDSSYEEGEHHAYPQNQTDQESRTIEVYTKTGEQLNKFLTNLAMAKQAELFPKVAQMLCDAGAVLHVHGSGLLPSVAQSMQKLPQAAE